MGDCTGGTETEDGGFVGDCETDDDVGEEAGALSAQTKIEDVVNNIESTKSERELLIFGGLDDLESTRMNVGK